jgi:hypothetical protein
MAVINETKNITPECQVVHFAWDFEGDSTGDLENLSLSQLSLATPHDISKYITSVSYQKTMEDASGQVEIILGNTKDWKDVIKKGSWAIIYLSQDGGLSIPESTDDIALRSGGFGDKIQVSQLRQQREKLRTIVYIDTVRARGTTGANGELDTEFVLSGRDFGAIYEETEIWHNQILFDNNLLQSSSAFLNSQDIKTVDGLLTVLHKLFYSPSDLIKKPLKNDSLVSIALQWLWPSSMMRALGIDLGGKKPYYGNIPGLLNFSPTKASFPVENPLALLNGIAWDRLKAHSIDPYHELFTEISDDGLPRLTFRMMPWKLFRTNRKFQTINPTIDRFADPKNGIVDIPTIDILDYDVGEDNHTRFNAYLTTVVTQGTTVQQSLQMIGDNNPTTGFPRLLQNGIRRHGLRLLYREMNALIELGKEQADQKLLKEFNEYAVEMWARSHEYESGTFVLVGNNKVRLGKVLAIDPDAPYNADKLFYIEGYEDSFTIDDNGVADWTQTVFVSRGIERSVLRDATRVNSRQTPFTESGEFTKGK